MACALITAVASILVCLILVLLFPFMGYAGLLLFYLVPAVGLVSFFHLMSEFLPIPTIISFVVCAFVWLAEVNLLVELFHPFRKSFASIAIWPIGAVMAAANKLIMDAVFLQVGLKLKEPELNRLVNRE